MTSPLHSLSEISSDVRLRRDDGWVDMDVRWLVTDETFGARHHVLGRTIFMPGGGHLAHKHPNAEEILYILRGRLCTTIGDETFFMGPEDVCYVPPDTLHVMRNLSPTEPCEVIFVYGGAPSLAVAGYVPLPAPPAAGTRVEASRMAVPRSRPLLCISRLLPVWSGDRPSRRTARPGAV